jgi:hypothetical protein
MSDRGIALLRIALREGPLGDVSVDRPKAVKTARRFVSALTLPYTVSTILVVLCPRMAAMTPYSTPALTSHVQNDRRRSFGVHGLMPAFPE